MFRLLVCFLSLVVVMSAQHRHRVSKVVGDHFRAIPLDKQKLTGLLGSRIRANSEGLLENVEMEALLRPLQAGGQSLGGTVEREFPGRFLDAAADAFEYNHDLQLRAQMDKVAGALASFVSGAESASDEAHLLVARCDLRGLLAYYRVTNTPQAYATAQAISGSLMKDLATGAETANETRESVDSPGAKLAKLGLIEPLLGIYRLSAEKKYLDFAIALAHSMTVPDVTDATSSSTLVGTLSALNGLADLYEVTGDAAYLQPVVAAWQRIATTRLSVTGAPLASTQGPPETDACTAASWMEFTFKLLRVTGEPSYGDQLERTIYNQILAGQDARTGDISAEVPVSGAKLFSAKLDGPSGRCVLSEAKALALLPQLVWGRYETGIAINLYTPGRAFFTFKKHGVVSIYAEGSYPETGQLQFHVEPSGRGPAHFPLRFRVPSWTDEFTVDVAGLHLTGRAGGVVIVDRDWRSGDTIRLSMSLPLRASVPAKSGPEQNGNGRRVILQRGPQVLTLGKGVNPDIADLQAATIHPLSSGQFQISDYDDKLPRSWFGAQVYRISGDVLGKQQDLLLVPFADAINYRTEIRSSSN